MVLPQALKVHISIVFAMCMCEDIQAKIMNMRKLVTLLKVATKREEESVRYKKIFDASIKAISQATELLIENDSNWGEANYYLDHVMDMLAPMVYDKYGDLESITFGNSYTDPSTDAKSH